MAPVSMPLSDLSARLQGHDIIQRQITLKWYKTEYSGGLIESHTWSIELHHLNDPKTRFQGQVIL